MQHLTDEELVSQYLETRQNDYFEQLYERYCNKVHQRCLSFTRDSMQAEDLTQDIFVRLIGKLEGYKKKAKFSTWLYSITKNYCVDQIKIPRRQAEIVPEKNLDSLLLAVDDSAEQEEEQAQLIELAMSKLTDDEQDLLRQKYQDDVSIKDLASQYLLTESAIKMRLKRSRDQLRELYYQAIIINY